MAALSIYNQAAVAINGRYIAQNTKVQVSFSASDTVKPLLGGGSSKTFVLSPDTRLLQVQWSMCLPSNDSTDLQFIRTFLDCEQVTLAVHLLGSRQAMTSTGFLRDPALTAQVGSTLEYSCAFIGPPGTFQ